MRNPVFKGKHKLENPFCSSRAEKGGLKTLKKEIMGHAEECGALKTQEEEEDLKCLDKPLAVSSFLLLSNKLYFLAEEGKEHT